MLYVVDADDQDEPEQGEVEMGGIRQKPRFLAKLEFAAEGQMPANEGERNMRSERIGRVFS